MEMAANIWSSGAGGGSDWRSNALARAPQVVTFLLALALAAQLALIVVGITSRSRQTAPPPVAAAPPLAQLDIGGLVNSHLFGNAVLQNTNGDGANAPPSSMPLVLAGLLATEDPKEGMAIIGESAAAAKVVAVGQQVPGGATLHSVYNDRAVIERNGALESVLLPRRTAGTLSAAPPPPPVAAPQNDAAIERMRRLVMPTTIKASCAASARARMKVTTWGARASAWERQSPPPPALGLQMFAVISTMIRFAPQQPQALVLSWQTDSA